MSNARNLSNLKPSTTGLIGPEDLVQPLTQRTVINSTTGTTIDFTSIPSWVKRITIMLNGVSTNGTAQVGVQLGTSGGIESTGYAGAINDGFSGSVAFSNAFLDNSGSAASTRQFVYTLTNVNGNNWICQIVGGFSNAAGGRFGAGTKSLSGTLDRVRIMTNNGTDTFDAGTVNIIYE